MIIDVRIDDKSVLRRIRKITNNIDKMGKATTEEIAKLGKDYIVYYMPKDTGEAARSMAWKTVTSKKGYASAKVYQAFIPHPEARGFSNGKKFNLVRWMFYSKKALGYWPSHGGGPLVTWKSGSVQNMRNVPNVLRSAFRRKVDLSIKRIIK